MSLGSPKHVSTLWAKIEGMEETGIPRSVSTTASACLITASSGRSSRASSRDRAASGSRPHDLYSDAAAKRVSGLRGSMDRALEKHAKACDESEFGGGSQPIKFSPEQVSAR